MVSASASASQATSNESIRTDLINSTDNIPVLTGPENYSEWARRMELFLRVNGLWNVVINGGSDDEQSGYLAMQAIYNTTSRSTHLRMNNLPLHKANEAWILIKRQNELG